ncbi:hypothetical protein FJTKL_13487 [Diaporthe vaccinii]|uniref:Uncharacterized protein n=1 Tax=Diaporthe vaccinii TaxID=105482 RepID=A0ABR4EAG5_9PEZI
MFSHSRLSTASDFFWYNPFHHPSPASQLSLLQLLHGDDVGGLDVVLEADDLLLKLLQGDLVVLDDQVDLELLDTEANGDELGGTPDQTILLDRTHRGLKSGQVGLVICGLNIHSHDGLGGGLRLALLLLAVLGQTLLTDTGGLSILLLVVGAEQVDIVVVISGGGGLGGVQGDLSDLRAVGGVWLGGIAGEGGELGLVRGDVLVPPGGVGVLGGVRGGGDGLEGGNVGLGGGVAVGGRDTC